MLGGGQRLRGDAVVQAGATETVLLDQDNAGAERYSVAGHHVAAGPAAEERHVQGIRLNQLLGFLSKHASLLKKKRRYARSLNTWVAHAKKFTTHGVKCW